MDFAISNPIVVTCSILALLPTQLQIMPRHGRESRPRHQKATFKFEAVNGWKAKESGLRLKA
jgi:carotenoid cleavage dioxygenase-like enzyme